VAVRAKTSLRTLAARRLVPRDAKKKNVIGIRVIEKFAGSGDPVLTSMDLALKRPVLNRNLFSDAKITLDLNYFSMI
jgi:hypothetical protein